MSNKQNDILKDEFVDYMVDKYGDDWEGLSKDFIKREFGIFYYDREAYYEKWRD